MSGGKDSFLASIISISQGVKLEYALSVLPEEESLMFHVPNIRHSHRVSSLLGLKTRYIKERDFEEYLSGLRNDGIECVVSGAIASDYQKTKIEKLCTQHDLVSCTPLWRKEQETIMMEVMNSGIEAIIVSVSAEGLDTSFLGRVLNFDLLNRFRELIKRREFNISGEGGEYETFVTGMRGYGNLSILKSKIHWSGSSGYLEILEIEETS